MYNPQKQFLQWLSFILFAQLFHFCSGDVGTATQYNPPYMPTACYGNDKSQFPSSYLFAAAGEGIWDNGAACGRQYWVRCIIAEVPRGCNTSETIQVKIVDRAQTSTSRPSRARTSIALSNTAFGSIADSSIRFLSIEYKQV